MITDPYNVLGVSQNASNDDIKKAYRDLSRKYHPDSYIDNPLSDLAEEKFKEVQEAYQQIMNERENGYNSGASQSYSGYGSQGNYSYGAGSYSSGSNDGTSSNEMVTVYNYINSGRYRDALNILSGINNRNAQWYYFSAVANMGMGNNYVGINHARQATSLDPANPEYRAFLNRIQNTSVQYNNMGRGYGRSGHDDMCDTCMKLWCADTMCECMGGDCIPCI